ncbi:MAG: HAMP domain-containing protein [Chloroflexi bacterium]|nr:HAMP domain-containing protein [Chloroflexota bacterium]
MYPIFQSKLGRRIVLLVITSMLLVLGALGISGWLATRESAARVFYERQALAQAASGHLDYVLRQNLARLENFRFATGVDIEDNDLEPEKRALRTTYFGSVFTSGVFVTDQNGTVIWQEPYQEDFVGTNLNNYAPIWQSLQTARPVVSNAIVLEPDRKTEILMVTPLHSREGRIVGLVGGRIDPLGRSLQEFTRPAALGEASFIDVIDANGVVLASSEPQRVLQNEYALRPRELEVVQSASLASASWTLTVRQLQRMALAPVRTMEQRFIIFGLVSLLFALSLSWGMARSLVKPLAQLTTAAQNISHGDLTRPVPELGQDEVGELGRSFDAMRIALKESLEEIQRWNKELEAKVAERTRQLEASYREIETKEAARRELLRKILTAQEEERKRIARELHDETTQSLIALVMRLETLNAVAVEATRKTGNRLADIKALAVKTLDNVHKTIFDLRPSVLDDLGLLSALRWYAENRLPAAGIRVHVEVPHEERKLPAELEIALFRIVQEAITNIIKHAEARNAMLNVEFVNSAIRIEVEDDGKGFDVKSVSPQVDRTRGLGLLGMEERVTLLGGKFEIESQPGSGTHLTIEVPLEAT